VRSVKTGSRLAQTSVNRSRQSAEAQMRGRTLSSVVRYLVPKLCSCILDVRGPRDGSVFESLTRALNEEPQRSGEKAANPCGL
jgi:hypothetical protein